MESVRRMRREKGLSQQELAKLAGVGQDSISAIETGKHEPHPRTLRKLAKALDVEVADFFKEPAPLADAPGEAGQPEPSEADAKRRTARDYQVGEAEAFFVPLEEGEEEDKVEIRFYYYQVLEGDEPILKAVRKASPEEAEQIREQLERSGG